MRHLRSLLTAAVAVSLLFVGACDDGGSDEDSEKQDTSEKQQASKKKGDESSEDSNVPFKATGPVAVVNGTEITADKFNEIVEKRFGNSRRPVPKQIATKMKTQMLESMIDKHLIEKKLEESDVEASDEEIQKEYKKFRENFPTDSKYQKFLDKTGTTDKEMKGNIGKDVRLRKILAEKKDIEVAEKEAKKHFENNKSEFSQPEQVKASHILIKTDKKSEKEAKKKAKEVLKKAQKEGTDFAKLAKEHSEGPSKRKGGDLGYFTKEKMADAFAEKAFSMKDGEIAGPVKTKFGFHIIKRTGYKEAEDKSFEDVKSEIMDKLEREKSSEAIKEYTKELREKAEIEKKPDNIEVTASGGGMGGLRGLQKGGKLKLKKGGGKGRPKGKGKGGAPKLKLKKPESLKGGSE